MTAESLLVFPPSRVLAGWWKQLAPLQPRALWVGHLLLHRVEALVALQRPVRLDALPLFALKAVALAPATTLDGIEDRLHLGRPLVHQLLRRLEGEQLVEANGGGGWSLTPLGRQGVEHGTYPRAAHERRAFYFVEGEQPDRPPQFLGLRNHPAVVPWLAADGWRFDAALLEAAWRQPAEWKERRGFPLDVRAIVAGGARLADGTAEPQPWQGVVLDRPERLLAAMVLTSTAAHGERLLGFGVRPEGWTLEMADPAFVLSTGWQEVLPELAAGPPAEAWRQAWRAWGQPRALPAAELEACKLEPDGCRLRVRAPAKLMERLRASRSDALKGEAWLLVGTGRLRTVVRAEVLEADREGSGGGPPEKK